MCVIGGGYNNGISENESGGNGGGVIVIECKGDVVMDKESKICADGGDSVFGGGGSGGSIKIACSNMIERSPSLGVISAIGGTSKNKDGELAGCGRIRISMKDEETLDKLKANAAEIGFYIMPIPHTDSDYVGDFVE